MSDDSPIDDLTRAAMTEAIGDNFNETFILQEMPDGSREGGWRGGGFEIPVKINPPIQLLEGESLSAAIARRHAEEQNLDTEDIPHPGYTGEFDEKNNKWIYTRNKEISSL